jgi:signal transduction histidine kinase
MRRPNRLRTLQWLTVLVPAVCAGLYETVRHSLLAAELPNVLGTLLAVALVLVISSAFAHVSFGIIRRMERRLLERNRELQTLTKQVQRLAVAEERDRLAREMHDGLAQVLAYLLVRLDTIEGLVERGRTAEAIREVQRLRASGEEAYADVREAIAGLRTRPEAGAAGLAAALREYGAQFADRTGVDVSFDARSLDADGGALSPAAELQLMRIAQEALTNVRKHARAAHVAVGFWRDATAWHLTVRDDGTGFDPEAPAPNLAASNDPGKRTAHFGLPIMRERAQSLGGTLAVDSRTGVGTTVHATVPVAVNDALGADGAVAAETAEAHEAALPHGEGSTLERRRSAALAR